jgi:hypothetical protein
MKERILKAVKVAQSMGYTIKQDTWIDEGHKCCCPLGAVVLAELGRVPSYGSIPATAACILSISKNDAESFANGFDGTGVGAGWYTDLGSDIAKEVFK